MNRLRLHVVDDLGRSLDLPARPRRIVSLVPSLTETLVVLGVGAALVAVTRYCTEPAADVAAPPKMGGTKNPDLVIMNAEQNRREDFEALTAGDLKVFVHFVDGKALSWYGPRIADGLAQLAALFAGARGVETS